ncbi:glycosyltransferase family 2 protein [Microbacterium sp. HJ5]
MNVPVDDFLTIGVPTYQRKDSVLARVEELCALPRDLPVRFLVIDNASDDGTYEALTSRFADDRLEVRRNDSNVGFAGNVLALIEHSRTEMLMFVSDEDTVHESGLRDLLAFCRSDRRRMVSPCAQVGAKVRYRGRPETRLMQPDEFESAAFYISGVTFDTAFLRAAAAEIAGLIDDNSAARMYPQVLLSALAVEAGGAWFLDSLVTTQVEQRETHIVDPAAGRYYGVVGRWSQMLGYEDFFERMLSSGADMERTTAMRESYRRGFRARLTNAVVRELPELAPYFSPPAAPIPPIHRRVLGRVRRALRRTR